MLKAEDAVLTETTGKGLFQVNVQTADHSFLMDEPVAFGGLSSGPSPFELVCAALGGCTLMTMKLYASRKGWTLDHLAVQVSHRKDSADARDTFERVIEFGEVTDEQRERLLYIAARCPVHLLLERGADVRTSVVETGLGEAKAEGLHKQVIDELCRKAA